MKINVWCSCVFCWGLHCSECSVWCSCVCFVGCYAVLGTLLGWRLVYGVVVCVLLGVMLYWVPCWDEDQCMVSLCVFLVLHCTGYPARMKISVQCSCVCFVRGWAVVSALLRWRWCSCVCFVECYTVLSTLLGWRSVYELWCSCVCFVGDCNVVRALPWGRSVSCVAVCVLLGFAL